MQTTLLGIAISLILALLAALVGPFFIDWASYRSELEAQARVLTGLEVRVTGAIDARLLPTPSLMLRGVELGRPNEAGRLWARALRVEFALGSLMRGEWRITDAELEGPEFTAELDESGLLATPLRKLEFKPESVAIERLTVTDGRAVLSDAATGSRLILDELEFRGELRSLAGPIKGEGSLLMAGQRFPYRISTGRVAEDSSIRMRLSFSPIDRALTAEADLSILVEQGTPRFEGSLQLARLVGRAPAGAQALIIEPWRLTSRIKGNASGALLDQIEFQYGPDERSTKLRGNASVTFGQEPHVVAALSSPQVDVDRLLALPETIRRRPTDALKALVDGFGTVRLPIATTLTIGVDALTLAGATLQRVAAEVKAQDDHLDIGSLEFRAPGATQVRLDGGVGQTPSPPSPASGGGKGRGFQGAAKIASSDPRTLLAWLFDRNDMPTLSGLMRLEGEVAFAPDGIVLDKLDFELDRMMIAGKLHYVRASDHHPARLDAALSSPGIDLDRALALAGAVLGNATLDWPHAGAVTVGIDRVSVAGIEAKQAAATMRLNPNGVDVERLAIADLDGASLALGGRIATKAGTPHGDLTIDVDARALDGMLAVVEKIAPQAADPLRRAAGRLTPVRMRAALAVNPRSATGAETTARFEVGGHAGALRVALHGDVSVAAEPKLENLGALATAKVNISGQVDAEDGGTLAEFMAIDRFVAVEKRPGRLSFGAIGPLDGQLAVEGRFTAGPLDFASHGTLRLLAAAGASAGTTANPGIAVAVKLSNANILSPRALIAGQRAEQLPVSIEGRLGLSEKTLQLNHLKGTIAGSSIAGRLAIDLRQQPKKIDGEFEFSAVDLPAGLAVLTGIPAPAGGNAAHPARRPDESAVVTSAGYWPAEPFERSAVHELTGEIAIKSAVMSITPKLAAQQVRAVLHFGEAEFGLQGLEGNLAAGQVSGELMFFHRPEGLGARARIKLSAADTADLLRGDALAGRLTLDAAVEGAGRSVGALIGSLDGSGTFKLENARVARLDPAAFNAIIRAVDQGLPLDAGRVKERMELALAAGTLAIPVVDGAIRVNSGQARLTPTLVQAKGADLAVNGSLDMAQGAIDARLAMTGSAGAGSASRPQVMIALKGPIEAPKRTLDVAVLASWLALRGVEQQSKKLDVLEGRAPPSSATGPAMTAPVTAPVESKAEPEPARPRPVPRSAPRPKAPAAESAPALPPPIDIRPAPTPRAPRAAGPQNGPSPQPQTGQSAQPQTGQPQPKAAAPGRPRSLSEILFGN